MGRTLATLILALATLATHFPSAGATVNVLVAISNQALGCIGGAPQSVAINQMAEMNSALFKSQASTRVNYVGFVTMNERAGEPVNWILQDAEVANARNARNADVVMAILTGAGGKAKNIPARTSLEGVAYTGCTRFVDLGFQHELGHLLGAHHQANGSDYGGNDPDARPYNAFYLYYTGGTTPNSCYRTLMAYPPNQFVCPQKSGLESTLLPWFSNDIAPVGSIPYFGDANHRNADSIDLNAPAVAQLRNAKIVILGTIIPLILNFITGTE